MDTAFPTIRPPPQFLHFMTITWSFELHNRVTNMRKKKERKKEKKKETSSNLGARPIGNFLNEPRPIFSKIITSVSPVIRVIGRGFPFLYKNPRNVPTNNSLHGERPQWRLRHTVSDHAQQYRNKRRIVYVSRINEYGLSARHDTHWFFFSSGADRERENPRRREDGHVWKVFSVLRTRSAVSRIFFLFAKTDHSIPCSMRPGFILAW